ncbi:MAG: GntR family transcriptional regulator [Mesorhizobium sp.]|nr:GntR family transcriptional regulator [Mesorhizobium sp.]MCO5159530.1 GntR family transcriptional regulator [Mesorhizobium sp.]
MSDTDTFANDALRKSAVARYLQLAGLFRRRIESGEWAVGSQIPTVEVLAKQFGVATMTIRQALNILEEERLIERHRAKGTFVLAQPKKNLWCRVHTDWTGLLIARDGATIEILLDESGVQLPPWDGESGIPARCYRHLRRRHLRAKSPFLLADVFVAEDIVPLIPESAYSTMTAMRLVADLPGHKISAAYQTLTIGAADLETANYLEIPLGDAVAKVQRIAIDEDGKVILMANGLYRGDSVRLEMKLR